MKKRIIPMLFFMVAFSIATTSCTRSTTNESANISIPNSESVIVDTMTDASSATCETESTNPIPVMQSTASVEEEPVEAENPIGEESQKEWVSDADTHCNDWDIEDGVRAYLTSECTQDLVQVLDRVVPNDEEEQQALEEVRNLTNSSLQEVEESDLVGALRKVRSIQITQSKNERPIITGYDYKNCTFRREVETLWFEKTAGSQRKMLHLHCWPSKHIMVDGIWYVADEEKVWDDEHKCTGVLQKNELGMVYMILQNLHTNYEEQFEVLLFKK